MKTLNTNSVKTKNTISSKATKFTLNASNQAFKILSSSLYENKPLAVLRETAANALDAARDRAANQANPTIHPKVEITLPTFLDPYLTIKDNGAGMSNEFLTTLYTSYFSSTKGDTNEAIGGFGIGSKAAFAICDQFTITSTTLTEITQVVAYKSDLGPELTIVDHQVHSPIHSNPNEIGTEVKIPITIKNNQASASKSWEDLAQETFKYLKAYHKTSTQSGTSFPLLTINGVEPKYFEPSPKALKGATAPKVTINHLKHVTPQTLTKEETDKITSQKTGNNSNNNRDLPSVTKAQISEYENAKPNLTAARTHYIEANSVSTTNQWEYLKSTQTAIVGGFKYAIPAGLKSRIIALSKNQDNINGFILTLIEGTTPLFNDDFSMGSLNVDWHEFPLLQFEIGELELAPSRERLEDTKENAEVLIKAFQDHFSVTLNTLVHTLIPSLLNLLEDKKLDVTFPQIRKCYGEVAPSVYQNRYLKFLLDYNNLVAMVVNSIIPVNALPNKEALTGYRQEFITHDNVNLLNDLSAESRKALEELETLKPVNPSTQISLKVHPDGSTRLKPKYTAIFNKKRLLISNLNPRSYGLSTNYKQGISRMTLRSANSDRVAARIDSQYYLDLNRGKVALIYLAPNRNTADYTRWLKGIKELLVVQSEHHYYTTTINLMFEENKEDNIAALKAEGSDYIIVQPEQYIAEGTLTRDPSIPRKKPTPRPVGKVLSHSPHSIYGRSEEIYKSDLGGFTLLMPVRGAKGGKFGKEVQILIASKSLESRGDYELAGLIGFARALGKEVKFVFPTNPTKFKSIVGHDRIGSHDGFDLKDFYNYLARSLTRKQVKDLRLAVMVNKVTHASELDYKALGISDEVFKGIKLIYKSDHSAMVNVLSAANIRPEESEGEGELANYYARAASELLTQADTLRKTLAPMLNITTKLSKASNETQLEHTQKYLKATKLMPALKAHLATIGA